jgi:starch phosphorylase
LARNLWWTWQPEVISLFRDFDPELWRRVNHNPVAFLAEIPPDKIAERASELAAESRISYAFHRLSDYLQRSATLGDLYGGPLRATPIAYFSAEFGLHESIPIYSGGLGILAGDHMKSASDLGLPLVGVGLLYAQGYFNQRLDAQGWQQESYQETEIDYLPVKPEKDNGDSHLRVAVETRSGPIQIAIWSAEVGRARLILLDSDVPENRPEDRQLTGRLYGGDSGTRIRQELILGVGGVRALAKLGIRPGVLHMNEGHSAFAVLEMARREMASDQIPFADAMQRVRSRSVFTTHTPVAAGHDRFDQGLIEDALGPLRDQLGLGLAELMGLGRVHPGDGNEPFCMSVLGLNAAWRSNAVSALHGEVTRRMWHDLWPNRAVHEVPIGHLTNGVHVASWIAPAMKELFDSYLGPDWHRRQCLPATWQPVTAINDGELWEAHQIIKTRLISYVQRSVRSQMSRRGEDPDAAGHQVRRLDPNILTVGFARRFATYKRGDLLLADIDRLRALITNADRPLQIVYAGKAHPKDEPGKKLIQSIFRLTTEEGLKGRLVFLEDYDINVTRHLIQGVDVWLNTPRRPLEACGTSGMKALFNGVLNLSVLDGWWAEAYDGNNGFAIGRGGEHSDPAVQDGRDAAALYEVLENDVIPLYYDREDHGVSQGWMRRVKCALLGLAWRFNAERMLLEYARECYLPVVGLSPITFNQACVNLATEYSRH